MWGSKQFLSYLCPIQFAFHLKYVIRLDPFLFTLLKTSMFYLHCKLWFFQSFSITTFNNFPGISCLSLLTSMFLIHIKPWFRCSTLPGSSAILDSICFSVGIFSYEDYLGHSKTCPYFLRSEVIICPKSSRVLEDLWFLSYFYHFALFCHYFRSVIAYCYF